MQTRIWFSLLLAAAACYSDRTVGVSKGAAPDEPAPAKAKFPSRITAPPGESIRFSSPRAGDMDGDGFDDFVLFGQEVHTSADFDVQSSLYLFYGRDEFPQELSTADADAVFSVDLGEVSGPVGDLNGDGLSDLMLVRMDSVEFVFGSKQRLHGVLTPNSAGTVWMAGELPPPFAAGFTTQFMPQRAGDLDGDGCADLIVGATALLAPEPDGTGGGLIQRPYLIRGHRGTWESAVFDPNWAVAGFGFDSGRLESDQPSGLGDRSLIYPERAGDLDGDGRDDLLATTSDGSLVFYGRREYPSELTSNEAEARLLPMPHETQLDLGPESWIIGRAWGDLDSDGMDDLAFIDPIKGDLRVVYGRRWSGEVQLAPELEIQLELGGLQSVQNIDTGDIDGDGFPELLVNVLGFGSSINFDATEVPIAPAQSVAAVYVIRGTGERLTGTVKLAQNDRWQPRGLSLPNEPEVMLQVSMAGDIDGDGGQDVLTSLIAPTEPAEIGNAETYLVPSTPRAPD